MFACCQTEVFATSWSLFQMNRTNFGASCVIQKPQKWGHGPRLSAVPQEKKVQKCSCKPTLTNYEIIHICRYRLWNLRPTAEYSLQFGRPTCQELPLIPTSELPLIPTSERTSPYESWHSYNRQQDLSSNFSFLTFPSKEGLFIKKKTPYLALDCTSYCKCGFHNPWRTEVTSE